VCGSSAAGGMLQVPAAAEAPAAQLPQQEGALLPDHHVGVGGLHHAAVPTPRTLPAAVQVVLPCREQIRFCVRLEGA